jgi:hypothetical protein
MTPTKSKTGESPSSTPKNVSFTPIVERAGDALPKEDREGETASRAESSRADSSKTEDSSQSPYFPLPPPTRPATEIARAPATKMYWHQPPTHGMMSIAPFRRSHSIAQVGSSIFLFGGSDGSSPKATDTVFIFDTGILPPLGQKAQLIRHFILANP